MSGGSARKRADLLLVERGLAASRQQAQALLLAGEVYNGEQRVDKAGSLLPATAPLSVRSTRIPYVSRGGIKLAGALDAWRLDVEGWVVGDIGASTGGFTDCLLQRGARRVYAIDVGHGQLHARLRNDPRVVVVERTNARYLSESSLPERLDAVTIDASFIGLAKLLPAMLHILRADGHILALVKPQFEVGRAQVGKGGVVRDVQARAAAIDSVAAQAAALGLVERGRCDAVISGPAGNLEAFLWLQRQP